MIEIDHQLLSKAALDGLLSELVLRAGTDYGNVEVSFEEKKEALLYRLLKGEAHIVYDAQHDQCDIVQSDHLATTLDP